MNVIIKTVSHCEGGRKAWLRPGEALVVGRTEEADMAIHADASMSNVHFRIWCEGDQCRIRDLESDSGTLLNDELVNEARVSSGDIVHAGQTRFEVVLEGFGDIRSRCLELPGEGRELSRQADDNPPSAATAEICSRFELSQAALDLGDRDRDPVDYVQKLLDADLFRDSVYFWSHALPKRQSVWWATCCVRHASGNKLNEVEEAALAAAEAWVSEPDECRRHRAKALADKAGLAAPAAWSALAAFWSGDSLAPVNAPQVPPSPTAAWEAVTAAVRLSALADSNRMPDLIREFIALGIDLFDTDEPWEGQPTDSEVASTR